MFFCNFGSVLEFKSSQKGAKVALEGGPGEVLEGQDAFLRTCIWTRFLQCFWNIRPLKRAPGRLQEGLVKVVHFWRPFLAKNVLKIDPTWVQKLPKHWFKNGA